MKFIVGYRYGWLVFVILCVGLTSACNLVKATPTPLPTPSALPVTPTFIGIPSITPLPGTGNGTPPTDVCPQPPGWVSYTILVGDTLTSLAEATFSTVAALMSANCLTNPDDIRAGEIIYLPIQPGPAPTQSG